MDQAGLGNLDVLHHLFRKPCIFFYIYIYFDTFFVEIQLELFALRETIEACICMLTLL
jgi:hypothetical protein